MGWMIHSLRASSGYLRDCPVEFTEGLNCIIGARGTCKSTIVETIRFVFDCDPARVAELAKPPKQGDYVGVFPSRAGLIAETLKGGTASCVLGEMDGNHGLEFVVERTPGSESRVFREGVQQIDAANHLHRVEIFSQGDLQGLAENPARRLALVDRPNQARVDNLMANLNVTVQELKRVGNRLSRRRADLETRESKVKELGKYREQLSHLAASRPQLSAELEAQKTEYERRRLEYQQVDMAVRARTRFLDALRKAVDEAELLEGAASFTRGLENEPARAIGLELSKTADLSVRIRESVLAPTALEPLLRGLAAYYEVQSQPYFELRKAEQEANEGLKQEEALKHAISQLEMIEAELSSLKFDHEKDLLERRRLRETRDRIRNELYELRLKEVSGINLLYEKHIILTLMPGVLSQKHLDLTKRLLMKSNLRHQDEVARDLAQKMDPSELIDIVESSDARRLSDTLQRDIGQMTRLVGHLMDHPDLYDLETIVPDDGLEITMVVQGESKTLGQLSKGQMATALLPLILREADYPLIVDQPEDDLDNAFVSDTLIRRVRVLSQRRQLIFVTHNANIPVLGEASNVVVMEMEGPRTARACRSGDVDKRKKDIITILEGGKEAFNQRQERYGPALG